MPPVGYPRPGSDSVSECVGSACPVSLPGQLIDWVATNQSSLLMIFLCLVLLYWWGCNWIRAWLEKNDMLRDKKYEKQLCPGCLEHFLSCYCHNTLLCGCAAKTAEHIKREQKNELRQRRREQSRVRALVRNARRRP